MADRIRRDDILEKVQMISNISGISFVVDWQMGKPRVGVSGKMKDTLSRYVSGRLKMKEMDTWLDGFYEMAVLLKGKGTPRYSTL